MNTAATPGSAAQMSEILKIQRAAYLKDGAPTLAARKADLTKLKNAILKYRSIFEKAASSDFGNRPREETSILDLAPTVQAINYMTANLRKWMRTDRRHVGLHFQPGKAYVTYQPLGVVGIMSPWNYPFALTLVPLATALAAGNRAMIKPSEFTPESTKAIGKMLAEIFPQEKVAVVTGDADVGAAFSRLPFDHLIFTGSTKVGSLVMKAASENIVPVTLELGGKSPAIVDEGCSLEKAARDIAFGKTANAGQTCIAPDYALVPESRIEAFSDAYASAVKTLYPGNALNSEFTTIVNDRHLKRLTGLLEDARAKGANVIALDASSPSNKRHPRVLAPHIVIGATDEMTVMQEEIFGPILPVVAYAGIDEAIGSVNAKPRPLALYYFGPNGDNRRKVLQETTSGNVTVNDVMLHYVQEDLPFGGVGDSGMGAYHGIEGFKTLSHAKGVFEQASWNLSGLVRPPFGRAAKAVMSYFLR